MIQSDLSRGIGGAAIALLFFFGTFFALDYGMPRWRNHIRAEDMSSIKSALAIYYKAHARYPGPADIPASHLKVFLVDEGFLADIPRDPIKGAPEYQYVSDGKTFYGLVVRLEKFRAPWGSTKEGRCLTGIGTETTRVFGDPPVPACPF
jgi:hypothetical protein